MFYIYLIQDDENLLRNITKYSRSVIEEAPRKFDMI